MGASPRKKPVGVKFWILILVPGSSVLFLSLDFYQQLTSARMGGWVSRLLFKFCLHCISLPLNFSSCISLYRQ